MSTCKGTWNGTTFEEIKAWAKARNEKSQGDPLVTEINIKDEKISITSLTGLNTLNIKRDGSFVLMGKSGCGHYSLTVKGGRSALIDLSNLLEVRINIKITDVCTSVDRKKFPLTWEQTQDNPLHIIGEPLERHESFLMAKKLKLQWGASPRDIAEKLGQKFSMKNFNKLYQYL